MRQAASFRGERAKRSRRCRCVSTKMSANIFNPCIQARHSETKPIYSHREFPPSEEKLPATKTYTHTHIHTYQRVSLQVLRLLVLLLLRFSFIRRISRLSPRFPSRTMGSHTRRNVESRRSQLLKAAHVDVQTSDTFYSGSPLLSINVNFTALYHYDVSRHGGREGETSNLES